MKCTSHYYLSTFFFLSLSVLFLVSCSTDSEDTPPEQDKYISIPDPAFEALLIQQGLDSEGLLDQRILKTDAEGTTRLEIDFSSSVGEIQNLQGIEGFLNLTFLSANQQSIDSLDLSVNTKLDSLLLAGNRLSSLDIGNNPRLILLDVQSNNLSSLSGLANLPNLKKLDVSFNKLETLSIPNASLETLFATNNLLNSLDIQAASMLKSALLTSNQLPAIHLSGNPLLETLLLSNNQIQGIDLQQNTQLATFFISSNLLTQLDVSHNLNLLDLRVDRNPNLTCIQIQVGQDIPSVSKSENQGLNSVCD